MLKTPIVLLNSVLKPLAVLSLPAVLADSEFQPCAVLFGPVVAMLSASTFSAALLLLPRSSLEGVGLGRGLPAVAVGESAKQAIASRTDVNMMF